MKLCGKSHRPTPRCLYAEKPAVLSACPDLAVLWSHYALRRHGCSWRYGVWPRRLTAGILVLGLASTRHLALRTAWAGLRRWLPRPRPKLASRFPSWTHRCEGDLAGETLRLHTSLRLQPGQRDEPKYTKLISKIVTLESRGCFFFSKHSLTKAST